MASHNSSNPPVRPSLHPSPNCSDPNSVANTTFLQADPSSFRAIVQKFTGKSNSGQVGPRRSAFKLHERRLTARKLEIKLNDGGAAAGETTLKSPSSSAKTNRSSVGENLVMASPVSPLDYLAAARGSPTTPRSPMEEEDRAIAEKSFYLHPNPLSTPRGSDPPELLPLFPLLSPRDN